MNVSCNQCGKKYVVSDEKVVGKSVKIRCKVCQNIISLNGKAAAEPASLDSTASAADLKSGEWADESTKTNPGGDAEAQWHAIIKGTQGGPYSAEQIKEKITQGDITLRTYFWKNGMADWKRAQDLSEVQHLFALVQTSLPEVPAKGPVPPPEFTPIPAPDSQPTLQVNALFDSHDSAVADDHDHSMPLSERLAQAERPRADAKSDALGPGGKNGPPIGEQTRFFMNQAGVHRRNPWWKFALFGGIPLALLGTFFALGSAGYIPIQVERVLPDGEVVKESVFSGKGMSGLKELLSGETARRKADAQHELELKKMEEARKRRSEPPKTEESDPTDPSAGQAVAPDLKDLLGSGKEQGVQNSPVTLGEKQDAEVKLKFEDAKVLNAAGQGLSEEQVTQTILEGQSAFQSCVERALTKQPNLRLGRLMLSILVGSSGVVKVASVEPAQFSGTEVGLCLTAAAKRLRFSRSPTADDTEVQMPLIVGTSL